MHPPARKNFSPWKKAEPAVSNRTGESVTEIDFDRLMAVAINGDSVNQIAVAVSGGADSMALCLLAGQWARSNGIILKAVTVDHGLRPDSAEEARSVGRWLTNYGIDHQILTWMDEKPETGIQAAARKARYRLMADWCESNGIQHLLVAHHLEDQVETFLMRLARGSGIDGLACMTSSTPLQAINLLRPLLTVPKSELTDFLNGQNQDWIEDPSNQNPAYARTQIRGLAADLEQVGVNAQRLGDIVDQFGKLKRYLKEPVDAFLEHHCRVEPEGYAVFDQRILQQLPETVVSRIVVRLVALIGGGGYPPRQDRLLRAVANLMQNQVSGFTLGGCHFLVSDGNDGSHEIMICREEREKSRVQVSAGDAVIWRNVFDLRFKASEPSSGADAGEKVYLRPLGKSGWAKILKDRPDLKDISVPYHVRLTLPALFDQRGVFDVALLGYRRDSALYKAAPPPVTFQHVHFRGLNERE